MVIDPACSARDNYGHYLQRRDDSGSRHRVVFPPIVGDHVDGDVDDDVVARMSIISDALCRSRTTSMSRPLLHLNFPKHILVAGGALQCGKQDKRTQHHKHKHNCVPACVRPARGINQTGRAAARF